MIKLFNKIRETEKYYITNFAKMDKNNKKFEDFEYFTIEKENVFFYIQKAALGGFEVTAFKKIDWNTKQQVKYPVQFYNFEELEKIITEMIEKNKKGFLNILSKTNPQKIFHELSTFYNFNNKYQTLEKHLKDIAGFRENEIFKNIERVETKINNEQYHVLEFYNKTGQSFAINIKNIERLIVS